MRALRVVGALTATQGAKDADGPMDAAGEVCCGPGTPDPGPHHHLRPLAAGRHEMGGGCRRCRSRSHSEGLTAMCVFRFAANTCCCRRVRRLGKVGTQPACRSSSFRSTRSSGQAGGRLLEGAAVDQQQGTPRHQVRSQQHHQQPATDRGSRQHQQRERERVQVCCSCNCSAGLTTMVRRGAAHARRCAGRCRWGWGCGCALAPCPPQRGVGTSCGARGPWGKLLIDACQQLS